MSVLSALSGFDWLVFVVVSVFVFVFVNFQKVQLEGGQDVCGPFYSHPGSFYSHQGSWLICLILLLNSLFSAEPTFYNFLLHTISCQKHLQPDFSLYTLTISFFFCVIFVVDILENWSQFVFDLVQSWPTSQLCVWFGYF